jgi:hypothetical protein
MGETICGVCGKPTALCSPITHNSVGGLTVRPIKAEDNKEMANRQVLISKERVYVSPDGLRRVTGKTSEPRKLLVGKGGEIEPEVARFYGVETEEALSVSIVTPAVEEDYNRMKKVGKANPDNILREKILDGVDPKSLSFGAGVSQQVSTMTSGIINKGKVDEPGIDHTTPIPATGADELAAEFEAKDGIVWGDRSGQSSVSSEGGTAEGAAQAADAGETAQTGQAQAQGANTKTKTIGNLAAESKRETPAKGDTTETENKTVTDNQ